MSSKIDLIASIVEEKCYPDMPAHDYCTYCSKQGMPILIARYAVRGIPEDSFTPSMPANSQVAAAMPWDLSKDQTINVRRLGITQRKESNQVEEVFDPVTLPSFSEYILRRPRKGYLYIYDEIYGGQWRGYFIDQKGYIKSEILSQPTSLVDKEAFYCTSTPENVALGSVITLPQPEISRTVYLAYVEAPWSKEWRASIAKNISWRQSHMQSFTMSMNCTGPDIYPIEQLEDLIFEYNRDTTMFRLDPNNKLLDDIFKRLSGYQSIAKFTKETLIAHAQKNRYPKPFILALHDTAGITLHLNELRVAQQLALQDKMQDNEEKRRHLCVTSIMSIENSIFNSPYAKMIFDPNQYYDELSKKKIEPLAPGAITYGVPQNTNIGKDLWETLFPPALTEKKPIPSDFKVDGVANGKTYAECLQDDINRKKEDTKFLNEHPVSYGLYHSEERGSHLITGTEELESYWDTQWQAHEQLTKEFYKNKYFSHGKYHYEKQKIIDTEQKIKKISERLDLDYCVWLENYLSICLELYDAKNIEHRAIVLSLLSRALTGGIIAQSSRNLWEKFHQAPQNNSFILKGILGWNDDLAKYLQHYLSHDTIGPVKNRKKPQTIFEEYYIKEIGKTIKKVNSLYKDRNKIGIKDFSKQALNAFNTLHEAAQEIADTVENTHMSLLASEQYIATNGVTEVNKNTSQNHFDDYNKLSVSNENSSQVHPSGLKVTQFKMLRIMHAHRMMCMDITAHIKSIETLNNTLFLNEKLLAKLEAEYSLLSRQLFATDNIERHIIFIERPFYEFFNDVKRKKAEKLTNKLYAIVSNEIYTNEHRVEEETLGKNGQDKTIKSNNYGIDTYSTAIIEQPIIYSDRDALVTEDAVNALSLSEESSAEVSPSVALDRQIAREKYNRILYEQYSKKMVNDFRDRWVGRLSRLAIYWGFTESFRNVVAHPSDLKAWWKMSGSVIFVTQSYFDVWEQAAKQRLFYLDAANEAEIAVRGVTAEYLVTGANVAAKEMQFAKLWSKRIGLLGSSMSIIDGFRDLAHASDMSEHGELQSDITITKIKGGIGILSGIIGIILLDTVFIGGFLAIFAFAIALWLLPSTETLMPLGVRNWLRRSLFKRLDDDARYLPFKNWEEEQSAFQMVLKGIEVDTTIAHHFKKKARDTVLGINRDRSSYFYNISIRTKLSTQIVKNLNYTITMEETSIKKHILLEGSVITTLNNKKENYITKFSFNTLEYFIVDKKTDPFIKEEGDNIILNIKIEIHQPRYLKKSTLTFSIIIPDTNTQDNYSFDLKW